MLNYTRISELYHSLDADKKKELLRELFGEGNQTMAYFKNGRDSRFSKIEILSDFFEVPIDSLREGTHYLYDSKTKTISPERKAQKENDKQKILLLEERIKLLQDALEIKEEHISLLLEKNEFYKNLAGK